MANLANAADLLHAYEHRIPSPNLTEIPSLAAAFAKYGHREEAQSAIRGYTAGKFARARAPRAIESVVRSGSDDEPARMSGRRLYRPHAGTDGQGSSMSGGSG